MNRFKQMRDQNIKNFFFIFFDNHLKKSVELCFSSLGYLIYWKEQVNVGLKSFDDVKNNTLWLLIWKLIDDEVKVLDWWNLAIHNMVEEIVPEHIMLKKVINMLEIFQEVLQSAFIVPNRGIGIISMIKHNSFHWESKICLNHAHGAFIIYENVFQNMWLVLIIINSNINQLLSIKVTLGCLIRLLNLERLDWAIIIVSNYWF